MLEHMWYNDVIMKIPLTLWPQNGTDTYSYMLCISTEKGSSLNITVSDNNNLNYSGYHKKNGEQKKFTPSAMMLHVKLLVL